MITKFESSFVNKLKLEIIGWQTHCRMHAFVYGSIYYVTDLHGKFIYGTVNVYVFKCIATSHAHIITTQSKINKMPNLYLNKIASEV